jgi:RecA/RadA recombinase
VVQQAASRRPISLFVGDLDAVLGGGLPRGEITEICTLAAEELAS